MDVDRRMRLNPGYIVSLLVIGIPSFLWMRTVDFGPLDTPETILTVVLKTSAFAGMAMFAWSLVLSGRYKFLDTLFHGLDKVYVAHRFFGTASVAILLLHPLAYSLLEFYREAIDDPVAHFLGFKSWAFTFGRISLYGLILVGLWSIYAKAKHETFVLIHRSLGAFFVLGALHAFLMRGGTVLSSDPLMWWYMLLLSLLAIGTFIHYSLLADILHPYHSYKIKDVKELPGDVWELTLTAKYRLLSFKAGQFAYLSFQSLEEKGYHPFTIASGEHASDLQFYIKELGDATSSFDKLKPGQTVRVKGPYGGFTFDDKRFNKQLWIGAGIGITPFLSKARSLRSGRHRKEVELIYATGTKGEAFAAKELQAIEHQVSHFNYTLLNASQFGQKSLEDLAEHFAGVHDYAIYICGPPGMLRAYAKQAKEMGLEDRLYYEEFSF